MIREGSIRWNAVAEIIPTDRPRPAKRKSKRERKIHDDARAAKKERRCGSEKIHPGKKETREKERERRTRRRRSRRVIGQTSRYFRTSIDRTNGRTDEQTNELTLQVRRGGERGGGKEVDEVKKEEVAMNFALPEETKGRRNAVARERRRAVVKNKRTTTTTGSAARGREGGEEDASAKDIASRGEEEGRGRHVVAMETGPIYWRV